MAISKLMTELIRHTHTHRLHCGYANKCKLWFFRHRIIVYSKTTVNGDGCGGRVCCQHMAKKSNSRACAYGIFVTSSKLDSADDTFPIKISGQTAQRETNRYFRSVVPLSVARAETPAVDTMARCTPPWPAFVVVSRADDVGLFFRII